LESFSLLFAVTNTSSRASDVFTPVTVMLPPEAFIFALVMDLAYKDSIRYGCLSDCAFEATLQQIIEIKRRHTFMIWLFYLDDIMVTLIFIIPFANFSQGLLSLPLLPGS
jgi:hypothetical protein